LFNNKAYHIINPDILQSLGSLTLKARYIVEGIISGLHRSPHHGSSIEFAEHKEYTPGDDIRHIDWKAFGKFDKYYVKQFEEETNVKCYFVVDASGSMKYGSPKAYNSLTKYQYAATIAASFAYLLLKQQDSVGIIIYKEDVKTYLPPRSSSAYLEPICEKLEGTEPSGETSLNKALEHLLRVANRRAIVFILTDFFDSSHRIYKLMAQFHTRRLQTTLFHILDPYEIEFPFDNLTIFKSMESKREILAEPALMRETYIRSMQTFIDDLRQECHSSDIEYAQINTQTAFDKMLLHYFKSHQRGLNHASEGRK
jgi:uncharacterized protein (DUF58 family)